MTQHSDTAVPLPHESGEPSTSPATVERMIGLDLARGLAVLGMYAVHVGPDPGRGGVTGFLLQLAHGRSSALFAFLAGFAIVLITGRSAPKTGRAGRQAVAKVIIRAVILLALGTALTMTGTPVEVILAFYGVYFLLVLPLYRLSAGTLAAIAVGTALVTPQVLYAVKPLLGDGGFPLPGRPDGPVSLLFTGTYPALTWIPFVIAGMAVARLDLTTTAVRVRLALAGATLAVIGYGGSWLAIHLVPGALTTLGASAWAINPAGSPSTDLADYPSDSPYWLLVASPHSETTLSILGNTGVAIAVVSACLAAMDAFPRLRRLARPVIAVGSMSLTAYVLHIAGIQLLGIKELPGSPLHVLLGFIAAAMTFALLWSRYHPRGPLEWLMAKATGSARHIR